MIEPGEQIPLNPNRHNINPLFEKRLPEILEELAGVLMRVKPELEEARRKVAELHDYIKFELEKAYLRRGDNLVDERREQLEDWIQSLEFIVSEYDIEHVLSSVEFLGELRQDIKGHFWE